MFVYYNGITFTATTVDEFSRTAVYDDSHTDKLYDRFYIEVTAVVNGQAEVRTIAGVPMSYAGRNQGSQTGVPNATRVNEAVRARPPGMGNPGATAQVPVTDSPQRQLGVFQQPLTTPYASSAGPPSFNNEARLVIPLDPVPNTPPLTAKLIGERLTDPRGQLMVFAGTGEDDELLLHSPGWGFPCDAKNGPLPVGFHIFHSFGEAGTFFIKWACETFLNEHTPVYTGDGLLSNRFSMTHSVDQDSFLTYLVTGTAIFDTRALHTVGDNPDRIRPNLMLPIPRGFVRGNIEVEGMPGMEGVNYSYTDRQLPISMPACHQIFASRVEAHHQQAVVTDMDMMTATTNALDSILNRRWLMGEKKLTDKQKEDQMVKDGLMRDRVKARLRAARAAAKGGTP